MKRTIRTQVYATALVAAAALGVILVSGSVVDSRVEREIEVIRTKFVPKFGLANQLETAFDKVGGTLRDAVVTNDPELLEAAAKQKARVLERLAAAEDVLDRSSLEQARLAVETYYRRAEAVTRRKLHGETDGVLARDTEAMQRLQVTAAELLQWVARVDQAALARQFAEVTAAQESGRRERFVVSAIGLILVLGLSMWLSRRLYKGVNKLGAGFQRFGSGDFATPIAVTSNDEISALARDANTMAARLDKLDRDRDELAWVKAGQVGLADKLRGELAADEVAKRAIAFLASYLGAPLGLLYLVDRAKVVRPFAGHGVRVEDSPSFAFGDGIVGQAATRDELTVIDGPAGRLPIRSGLTEAEPTHLVLAPLLRSSQVIGVVELAVLDAWTPIKQELLVVGCDAIAIAIEVARSRDATRGLLAESQRQAAELLSARRGIEEKADELARASTFKSQFLANMSHELRTPLNAIIGFSELLVDNAVPRDSAQATEFLDDILTSGRHLLQLINDVLDLSKVEAGRIEFAPTPTRLSSVVREVLAILRTQTVKKRLQVATEIATDIDAVTLDPARLKQVLYNYLSNAIKFTPDGGKVWVRARAAAVPGQFRIEVEDTGPGIPAHELERLFVEFQQTTAGVKTGAGTGLGLALTKRLVEAQGGNVGISTTVGQGSLFFAVLPRVAAPLAQAEIRTTADAVGKPTILVVEDDERDREQLASALERAGYAVEAVGTGAQAVARGQSRIYDAITLDLLLPDMTGLEVLQQLRTTRNTNVPIVLITIVAEKGAVAGFAVHDILPKPLDEAELVASLARAGVAPGKDEILVVDDDSASLRMISTMLGQLGHASHCEADPVEGLARAIATEPRAIILDLIMPGLSGFEFLDRLRKDPVGRRIPVIVWTSKDLTADERATLRELASVVVTKGSDGNAGVLAELSAILPGRAA